MTAKPSVDDLPAEYVQRVKKVFDGRPRVIELKNQRNMAIRTHDYVKANQIDSKLKSMLQASLEELASRLAFERVNTCEILKNMSKEDYDNYCVRVKAIFLLSDMLETFSMDINSIIQKYEPRCWIDMHDKLVELGKEARQQISYVDNVMDEDFKVMFGDVADDLTELVLNKCRSFTNKLQEKDKRKKQ